MYIYPLYFIANKPKREIPNDLVGLLLCCIQEQQTVGLRIKVLEKLLSLMDFNGRCTFNIYTARTSCLGN